MAITSSAMIAPAAVSTARHVPMGAAAESSWWTEPTFARARRFSTRGPMSPSSAGVRVTAISTAMSTANAPTVPMSPRKGMPVMFSASSAMMTVEPAKVTAFPAVPLASPMDSRISAPSSSCLRWRLMMNSE